mmetsp:Transcript_30502/g.47786  ORF Transcript_30502/g.47786 Transcript_30502/m.47786 type:complete len:105 (-) Transcript_30502:485-799(-)
MTKSLWPAVPSCIARMTLVNRERSPRRKGERFTWRWTAVVNDVLHELKYILTATTLFHFSPPGKAILPYSDCFSQPTFSVKVNDSGSGLHSIKTPVIYNDVASQ